MKIRVLIQPIEGNDLSAVIKDYHIPIPKFLMKGVLLLKPQLEKAGLGIARAALQKKNLNLQLDKIELLVDQSRNTIEGCCLSVSDIDYPRLISGLLPEAKQIIAEKEDMRPVFDILELLEPDTYVITRDAMNTIGNERMEQILKVLLSAYNDRICALINEQIEKKYANIRITELTIL